MEQKIRDALANLDVENDDHWTAEGMPRLDVVKDAVGTAVSRADITAAAKGFTRKTPNLEVEKAESTGSGESADEEAATSEETENTTPPAEPEGEVELGGEDEVEAELKAAQDAVYKANDRLRKAQAAMDAVIDAKVKQGAQRTTSHDIKAYQQSQNEQRQALARRRQRAAAAMAAAEDNY